MKNTTARRNIVKEAFRKELVAYTKKQLVIKNFNLLEEKLSATKREMITHLGLELSKVRKNVQFSIKIQRTATSRIFKSDNCHEVKIGAKTYEKFTWNYLHVTGSEEFVKDEKLTIFDKEVVIFSKNGSVAIYIKTSRDVYTHITKRKDFTIDRLVEMHAGAEMHRYAGLCWTASNKRNRAAIFIEITNGDNRFDILDEATSGAMSKMAKRYPDLKADGVMMKVMKEMGYIGNVSTSSTDLGEVSSYIIFNDKWKNTTPEYFLSKEYDNFRRKLIKTCPGISQEILAEVDRKLENAFTEEKDVDAVEVAKDVAAKLGKDLSKELIAMARISKRLESQTQDGQMYVNAEAFAKLLSNFLGIEVLPQAVVGTIIQLRPGTVKASAVIVSAKEYAAIVRGCINLAGDKIGVRFVNNCREVPAKDAVEDDMFASLFIGDTNCFKLDFDTSQAITMELLAWAKRSEGRLSKQMAQSISFAGKKLGKQSEANNLIFKCVRDSIEADFQNFFNKKAAIPTPEEVSKAIETGYFKDLQIKINPSLLGRDKAFYNYVMGQVADRTVNRIDKMSGDIKSFNMRLGNDPTFIITGGKLEGVLKFGEAYVNDKSLNRMTMMKYPKMGVEEYYVCKNVLHRDIVKRLKVHVEAGTITEYEADRVAQFYRELNKRVAYLPPRALVALACAGLDFDYDGAVFICHSKKVRNDVEELTNKIVEILEEAGGSAVWIQ